MISSQLVVSSEDNVDAPRAENPVVVPFSVPSATFLATKFFEVFALIFVDNAYLTPVQT